jgi:hypothetical protein
MKKSLKTLFMASMLPVMMLMAAITLTSCEGTLDDIFGEWSRPGSKEQLLENLNSALEEGAIFTITYTIDDVEYTSTFKKVGDEYIEQSTTPASARAMTRGPEKYPTSSHCWVETNETTTPSQMRVEIEQANLVKLDVTLDVSTCEETTNYASSEGSKLKSVKINGIKANKKDKKTGSVKIWGANTGGADKLLAVLSYTDKLNWNTTVKSAQKNGSRYLQIDKNNQRVVFAANGYSGYLLDGKNGREVNPSDQVGYFKKKKNITDYYLKEFDPISCKELSWDATNHEVVTNSKTFDHYNMVIPSNKDVIWNAGTYVVNEDIIIEGKIYCKGDVNLILYDDCTLEVNNCIRGDGTKNVALTIYGKTDNCTGTLSLSSENFGFRRFSNLVIHGGNIEVITKNSNKDFNFKMYGGKFIASNESENDPVIKTEKDKNMTIYGGELEVISGMKDALVIGDETNPGTLNVYGGMLTAYASDGQAIKGYFAKGEGTSVSFYASDDVNFGDPLASDVNTTTKHYFQAKEE